MLFRDKKGFLQISFAWLFAIIVGAMILFLAIFAVVKTMNTEETISDVKTAKEIGILLNPLETGFVVGQTTSLNFPVDTRIHNICDNETGFFGKQRIGILQKSFNKWSETDLDVGFANKYIFSEKITEGKNFYLFSKPFNFPFKVTDLIYLTSGQDNYCFVDSPTEIIDELSSLKPKNIFVEDCPENSIQVCFKDKDCDIYVDYSEQVVDKGNDRLYFRGGGDALMYAAIFSDVEIYNCQLQRLMDRTLQLSQIYIEKEDFISNRGCNSNLQGDLTTLNKVIKELSNSAQLTPLMTIIEDIKSKNDMNSQCRLW